MNSAERLTWLQLCSPSEAAVYLGERSRETRRALGQTQAEFALAAGVPLRTYKRFETSGAATLETFIKVLQAVSCGKYLSLVFPVAPADAIPMSRRRALDLDL